MIASTPYHDVNMLLDALHTRIRSVLGGNLVGIYLYGSLVSGDFDPDVSDIDLLAATSQTVSKGQLKTLKTMHTNLARRYPKWNDRIEVQYASLSALRTFKTKKSTIVTISPGEPIRFVRAGNDWLVNWYELQEEGAALVGPHQSSVIPTISPDEYKEALRENARYWQKRILTFTRFSRRGSGAYIVLTMCRMLYGFRCGKQASKAQAAAWAAKEYPQWAALIADARSWRGAQWKMKQKRIGSAIRPVAEFVSFATKTVAS